MAGVRVLRAQVGKRDRELLPTGSSMLLLWELGA